MANSLSITDGTTTISLSSTGCTLLGYTPTAPQYDASGAAQPQTETIEFMIADSSVALVQAKVAAINRLLLNIQRGRRGERARCYLYYQTGADVAFWRSELMAARLELGADANTNLYQQRIDVALIVTRAPYWEAPSAEVALGAKTFPTVPVTGGVTIKNYDSSASYGNWVQIAAGAIGGDLPAAVKLQLTNATGSARTWQPLYAAVNSQSDPGNFAHVIEAEARLSGGSVVVNASASGGNELDFTIAGSTQAFSWTLSATMLQDTCGRPFRLLLSVLSASGSPAATVRAELRHPSTSAVMWVGDTLPMRTGAGILDLGVIPLPPGRYGSVYGALRLVLTFEGTGTFGLDYLQFMPAEFVAAATCITSLANGTALVIDSSEDRTYVVASGADYPYAVLSGPPLYLEPNVLQRILFMASSPEAGPAIADQWTVRVWAAARRSTI